MKLSDLLRDVPVLELQAVRHRDSSVTPDSRLVRKGCSSSPFPARRKTVLNSSSGDRAWCGGHRHLVRDDQQQGTVLVVENPRAALAAIAANFHGRPADRLSLVGGPDLGKTTTTRMIESVFDASGAPVGLIGTIEYRAGDERLVSDRTTPDAAVLQEWFAKMVSAGVKLR